MSAFPGIRTASQHSFFFDTERTEHDTEHTELIFGLKAQIRSVVLLALVEL